MNKAGYEEAIANVKDAVKGYIRLCTKYGDPIPPHMKITAPNHKTLKKGTLRAIIRASGIDREQFVGILTT